MTIDQAISTVSQLPVAEQILVVQAIWDRLALDAHDPITPEIQDELDRRWAEYKSNPDSAIPIEEFRKQVQEARDK